MKVFIQFVLILIVLNSCSKDNDDQVWQKVAFYHYGDSLIYLQINHESICISFNKNQYFESDAISLLKRFPEIDMNKTEVNSYYRIFATLNSGMKEEDYLKLLNKLNLEPMIEYATPGFISGSDQMFLTNKFFIKPNMSQSSFDAFLSKNSSIFSKIEDFTPGTLFIINQIENGFEAMDYANEINDLEGIEYSDPDFTLLGHFLEKK
jgi:hypothetical protein